MNLTNPTTTTTTATPETDTDTPPTKLSDQHHPAKVLSFTNGALKHHHNHVAAHSSPPIYRECMKNHAASLGGHALDGCGEFMPSTTATASDLISLKCAACGCHRNFHRRDPDDGAAHIVEYLPHPHPHQVLPRRRRSPSSVSPPPISSSYYPSAPHMLLALSTRGGASAGKHEVVNHNHNNHHHQTAPATTPLSGTGSGRKRFRTKFSQEQKEKMLSFSERMGWKMQKRDEGLVEEFCNEVGVGKGVLKVWMHNNKHTFGKRSDHVNTNNSSSELHSDEIPNENDNNAISTITTHNHHHHQLNHDQSGSGGADAVNNGSSSSS